MKPKDEFTEKSQTVFYVKVPMGDGVLDFGRTRKFVNPAPTLLLREEP
jgi:hypothetical protein